MVKFIILFYCLLMLTSSTLAISQDKPVLLNKNPFSQPDFLKYRPPVVSNKSNRVTPVQDVPEFTLTATFISVNVPMAIINDELLTLGEEIDGIKLMMVGEDQVKIRYGEEMYTIPIKELPASQTKIRRNVVK